MTDSNTSEVVLSDFVEADRIPELYPNLYRKNAWSHVVIMREQNGLGSAFRRVGKKLFVNVKELAACIDRARA